MMTLRLFWTTLLAILIMAIISTTRLTHLWKWWQPFTTSSSRSRSYHPVLRLPDVSHPTSGCTVNPGAWECVGGDWEWGLVFVDHRPGERRSRDVVRMVYRFHTLTLDIWAYRFLKF